MITIRPAKLSDAEPLSAMICETSEHLLRPHYNEAQWNVFLRYYSPAVLLEKLKSQHVFCAENAGIIVGTIALDGDTVVGFYTRLSCLNQGIGKRLMEHLEAWCLASGISQLQLAASPEGLAFYYKNG